MIKKSRIELYLKMFPEVMWDRFCGEFDDEIDVYGWIDRKDGKKDFLVIEFTENFTSFLTSSAKYSKSFNERIGSFSHEKCKRVENFFKVKNSIKLKK